MKPAIEFQQVHAGYAGTPVLRDISLVVSEGEMVGVLGPNGAGKTTLFRVLAGLHGPASGAVRLFGRDVGRLSAQERAGLLAVVPQELQIPVAFTVEELVMIGRTASLSRWAAPSPADRDAVERAMTYTDVMDLRRRPVLELSGGEKQRAVIAMALAQEPRIILMDEVTSHLDINHRLETMQIAERLNQDANVTVLFSSHDLNLAAEFCRRLLVLDQGRLVADGEPGAVLTEALLRRVYHCDVRVHAEPATGVVSVMPARRLTAPHSGRGVRVHVICGGGSGEEAIRRLSLCDYAVTCGVLNQGDSDAAVTAALGMATALERPFSPIGAAALERARRLAGEARAVIVCGMPVGPANLANLSLAEEALGRGTRVLIMDGTAERDYTPDGAATARVAELVRRGAVVWRNLPELFEKLPRPADGR